jgi:hypothetical protein
MLTQKHQMEAGRLREGSLPFQFVPGLTESCREFSADFSEHFPGFWKYQDQNSAWLWKKQAERNHPVKNCLLVSFTSAIRKKLSALK